MLPSSLFPASHHKLQPWLLTLSTSIGTWAAGGKLAGTLTLMAGVWATLVCGYWEACCLCCSRRSCSWSCSRISCCRSRMRDVMAEELSGGLEEPCWSDELLSKGREICQISERRQWGCGGGRRQNSEGRRKDTKVITQRVERGQTRKERSSKREGGVRWSREQRGE